MSNLRRILEVFNKCHTLHPISAVSSIIPSNKSIPDSCMENALIKMNTRMTENVDLHCETRLGAYGPHWCVMLLCFLFYIGWQKKAAPGSGRILLHGKEGRTTAQEFLTSMLVSATGQIISFHVILVVCPAGENLRWKLRPSSYITHIVQCSCSDTSPRAVMQQKKSEKGGEKGEINREEREPYWKQHRFFQVWLYIKAKNSEIWEKENKKLG